MLALPTLFILRKVPRNQGVPDMKEHWRERPDREHTVLRHGRWYQGQPENPFLTQRSKEAAKVLVPLFRDGDWEERSRVIPVCGHGGNGCSCSKRARR